MCPIKDAALYDLTRDVKVQCKHSLCFQTLDVCVNIKLALFEKHQEWLCVCVCDFYGSHFPVTPL